MLTIPKFESLEGSKHTFPQFRALPQNCHSEERRRPTKNLVSTGNDRAERMRTLAKLGVTKRGVPGAPMESGRRSTIITFEAKPRYIREDAR